VIDGLRRRLVFLSRHWIAPKFLLGNVDSHRPGRARNRLHRGFQIRRGKVFDFGLRDLLDLRLGDLADLFLFGIGEPFSIPAAFSSRLDAGGLLVTKVKERSLNTVTMTGTVNPAMLWVCALNALQNSMMLTPRWPSAGPTGGAGLAAPAGICNFICPTTFFAT
jgi:hypothetical protein